MSQSPSIFGTITTSSLSPISPTSRVMSSMNQGELSAFTRAQSPVEPKSVAFAIAIKPSRAACFASIGIASSRLPSTTSTWPTSSAAFARIFSLCGGTKWIMRSSREGSSVSGRGAPIASGSKYRRGAFTGAALSKRWRRPSHRAVSLPPQFASRPKPAARDPLRSRKPASCKSSSLVAAPTHLAVRL